MSARTLREIAAEYVSACEEYQRVRADYPYCPWARAIENAQTRVRALYAELATAVEAGDAAAFMVDRAFEGGE